MNNLFRTIFLLSITFSQAQNQNLPQDFRSPLDIPRYLAGNFAELRGFHFHSGIDIKTQQREGKNVYAIGDGYISRISISPSGYGNCLYVTHPNGYTSVYAHLREFKGAIEDYARKQQHLLQSFEINVYPPKEALPVKKGDVIALSGNSGSSGGPHLHFEIRDTKTEETINPFLFGLTTPDTRKPMINGMYIYALNGNVAGKKRYDLTGATQFKTPIYATGEVAFGIKTYDKINGAENWDGIYNIKVYANNDLIFEFKTDQFSFDETRYINCLTDYAQYMTNKGFIYQLYKKPGNQLRMIKLAKNDGILDLANGKTYNIKIVVSDFAGNTSTGTFTIVGKAGNTTPAEKPNKNRLYWDKENYWTNGEVELSFPPQAFYEDFNLEYKKANGKYYIQNDKVPLHKFYTLAIVPKDIPTQKVDKAVIAVEYNYGGKKVTDYFPTSYQNGKLVAEVRDFGVFKIDVDETAPSIQPLDKSKTFSAKNGRISFRVKDSQSGIKKYDAYIDGKWAIPVYDKKNKLIYVDLNKEDLNAGSHQFELKVTDFNQNVGNYATTIIYQ
ncbi:M23 family metallopeptidase [Ornithobacterium rhinotracheale]